MIKLYVKSTKTFAVAMVDGTSITFPSAPSSHGSPARYENYEPERQFALSENQQRIVETVERAAHAYGLQVEILDMAKENVFRRILLQKQEGIKSFPTLVAESGERLEGEITEGAVKSLFARIANQNRKKYI